jgi:ribosomal-protein-alanine N-acetyltransferase
LRPLELSDAEQTQVLFPHWEIVRYIRNAVPWPYPPDGAYKFYRDVTLPAVARGDEWAWTIRLKSAPDQLIGAISLFRSETDNRGFWLGFTWHRQGLMTEACDAVTDYWLKCSNSRCCAFPKPMPMPVLDEYRKSRACASLAGKTVITFLAVYLQKYGKSPRKSGDSAGSAVEYPT